MVAVYDFDVIYCRLLFMVVLNFGKRVCLYIEGEQVIIILIKGEAIITA